MENPSRLPSTMYSFSEEFSSLVPNFSRSNFTTLSPNPSEGCPLNEHMQEESQTLKTMESCKKEISRKVMKKVVAERTWTKEEIESLMTLWEESEIL